MQSGKALLVACSTSGDLCALCKPGIGAPCGQAVPGNVPLLIDGSLPGASEAHLSIAGSVCTYDAGCGRALRKVALEITAEIKLRLAKEAFQHRARHLSELNEGDVKLTET